VRSGDVTVHEMLHVRCFLRGVDHAHKGRPWFDGVVELSPAVLGRELAGIEPRPARQSVKVRTPVLDDNGVQQILYGKPVWNVTVGKLPVDADRAAAYGKLARWPSPYRPADTPVGRLVPVHTY